MSELINTHDNRATIRWKLLTGASALALTAYVASTGIAGAEDADRPQVWIELGGQMEMMNNFSSPFTAPFLLQTPTPDPYKGESPISAAENTALCLWRGRRDQFPARKFGLDILRRYSLWPLAHQPARPSPNLHSADVEDLLY